MSHEDEAYLGMTKSECFNKLSKAQKEDVCSEIIRQYVLYEREYEAGHINEDFSPTNPVHDGFEDLPIQKQEALMESFIKENFKGRI